MVRIILNNFSYRNAEQRQAAEAYMHNGLTLEWKADQQQYCCIGCDSCGFPHDVIAIMKHIKIKTTTHKNKI